MIQVKIDQLLVDLNNYHKNLIIYNLNLQHNLEKKFFNLNL